MDARRALCGGAGGTGRAAEREQSTMDAERALRGGTGTVQAAEREQSAVDAERALRGGTASEPRKIRFDGHHYAACVGSLLE